MTDTQTSVSDLVWGAKAIGAVINKSTRATFHLLELGQLPAKKVGSQWVASAHRLRSLAEEISQ